jgi:molecular chaperone DnaK
MEAGEKENIEAAIKELEEVMQGDDKDAIEAKTKALTEASEKLVERAYAQQAEQGAAEAAAGNPGTDANAAGDDVVDAEFEEVDDKK